MADRSPIEAASLRRVEPVMGTVISIEVRPPLVPESVLDDVFEQLRDVEARFSTYRPESARSAAWVAVSCARRTAASTSVTC